MKRFLHLIPLLVPLVMCKTVHLPAPVKLPNGWSVSPSGKSQPLGDLPLNMAISPDGLYMIVSNSGQGEHSLQLIDIQEEKVVDNFIVPVTWVGVAFSGNRHFYISGGTTNKVFHYEIVNKRIKHLDEIALGDPWPKAIWPGGLCIDAGRKLLYTVTREDKMLYIVDLATKKVNHRMDLGAEGYTCILSKDFRILYISLWGKDEVLLFDTQSNQVINSIPVGNHPNDMCLSEDGNYLYVANANDNSVSILNLMDRKVIETLNTALYPGSITGSGTNSVALDPDQKTLYIANADNNCLAVFDISQPGKSKSLGFIPTGWYPTSVKVVKNKIWVANGKGVQSAANPKGPSPVNPRENVTYQQGDTTKPDEIQYIGGLFRGNLSIIEIPNQKTLAQYTNRVIQNIPYKKENELVANGRTGNPIPRKVGDPSPIKYVFYIIKENRTYDQVLGDVKEGNGDATLCLFPEPITPNQHALAREFVLLDNFYVDAEVSADGHNWSTGAYATDYVEKTWPMSYGGRGGNYDFEGTRKLTWPQKGYIWDHCKRAGVSYRTYGEYGDRGRATIPALEGHVSPGFTGWNMSVRDTTRFRQWKHDFDSLLARNAVPKFNSIRMGNDHTEGLRKGSPSPFAHVADNDLAVGLFVEHLSKSRIWNESVVFILEDDAQNGPDHVDAHRSIAFVAGGLVKRNFVDHTMYSTSSMLRTIELILGIAPMSQYDAAAIPMWRCFSSKADNRPFLHRIPNADLDKKNTAMNKWQKISETFDLSKEDAVNDILFNEVLWYAVKGEHHAYPGPRRAAFLNVEAEE